ERPLWSDVVLAVLHGAPLAIVAYAVASLLLHQDVNKPAAILGATPAEPHKEPELVTVPTAPQSFGYVYVLRADNGTYKIGMARDVAQRVQAIAAFVPFHIDLIVAIETDRMRQLERGLHECFAERRLRGEWFALLDSDVEAIEALGCGVYGDDIDLRVDTLSALVNVSEVLITEPKHKPRQKTATPSRTAQVKQIASARGVSETTIWRAVKRGEITLESEGT
ncbi:MAG TPA: GIY-YIG nuclease family protein, partial [Roseiflexaceae bacterium]|nr:GIY-YIG nuclease family protein [Roseiflexaceae bacterium]